MEGYITGHSQEAQDTGTLLQLELVLSSLDILGAWEDENTAKHYGLISVLPVANSQ
jgi:hypothetical protein